MIIDNRHKTKGKIYNHHYEIKSMWEKEEKSKCLMSNVQSRLRFLNDHRHSGQSEFMHCDYVTVSYNW